MRHLAITLAGVLVTALLGCGDRKNNETGGVSDTSVTVTTPDVEEAPVEARDFSFDDRQGFAASIRQQLTELDRQIEQLAAEVKSKGGAVSDRAVARIRQSRKAAEQQPEPHRQCHGGQLGRREDPGEPLGGGSGRGGRRRDAEVTRPATSGTCHPEASAPKDLSALRSQQCDPSSPQPCSRPLWHLRLSSRPRCPSRNGRFPTPTRGRATRTWTARTGSGSWARSATTSPTSIRRSGKFRRYEIEDGALPHNLIVDKKDMVWYAGNGNGHIGKLDPATGKITRYPMPTQTCAIRTRWSSTTRATSGSRCSSRTTWAGSAPGPARWTWSRSRRPTRAPMASRWTPRAGPGSTSSATRRSPRSIRPR